MSTRAKLRRKVVLAVTVIRCSNQERQIAHTLDVTETSARLGGLSSKFESGEMIEIQRGAVKARFQVVWMGGPGGPSARQAGVRCMEPKVIWGVDLPADERDAEVDIANVRSIAKPRNAGPSLVDTPRLRRSAAGAPAEGKVSLPALGLDAQPARVLITICKTLADNYDVWRDSFSAAEMEELREALSQLQQRLSPPHEVELMDYLSTTLHSSGRA